MELWKGGDGKQEAIKLLADAIVALSGGVACEGNMSTIKKEDAK
jgi:hypothetical protein